MNECGILTRYNGNAGFVTYNDVLSSVPMGCYGWVHPVDLGTYEAIDEAVVSRLYPLIYESAEGDDM